MNNIPIKMIYRESEATKQFDVDVYDFHYTQDVDGNLINTFVTAWVPSNKTWLTAPIWCFKPIDEKKILKEGE